MFCNSCGKEIPDNSDFCRHCGKGQNDESPEKPKAPRRSRGPVPRSRYAKPGYRPSQQVHVHINQPESVWFAVLTLILWIFIPPVGFILNIVGLFTGPRRGCFLVMLFPLMILFAIIFIAIAVPSLMSAIETGSQTSALGSLMAINSANAFHKSKYNKYAGDLQTLGNLKLLDEAVSSGTKDNYRFIYKGGASAWECYAIPTNKGTSFWINKNGEMFRNSRGDSHGAPDGDLWERM
jgi:Tfp pilus assembly protein PilE